MELLTYYKKVASKTNWIYVLTNFLKLKEELNVIRTLSDKFGTMYLYEKWIKHPHLQSYSMAISLVTEYHMGRGHNYQQLLKKLFGAV